MSYKELYNQCNIHLVESDKKRDQIIAFYVTLVGFFVAFANNSNYSINLILINSFSTEIFDRNEFNQIITIFCVILVIVSFILCVVILEYRKWHIRYSNTVKLLNHFLIYPRREKEKICDEVGGNIYSAYGINNSKKILSRRFAKRYFWGVEAFTYQAFLVVSYFPVHLLLDYTKTGIPIPLSFGWVFTLNILGYLLIVNIIATIHMYNDFKKHSLFARWMLPIDIPSILYQINPQD